MENLKIKIGQRIKEIRDKARFISRETRTTSRLR